MASETQKPNRGEALSPERRRFMGRLSIALSAVAAVIVGIPVVGFILGPLLVAEPDVWRAVGAVDSFKAGEPSSQVSRPVADGVGGRDRDDGGVAAASGIRSGFVAFAINCAHLGCPVRWLPTANLFMCPCHGGVYYADGDVAAGPPPRRLFKYPVRVRDGQVEILASAVPIE